jgi:hypothetical protein
VTAKFIFPDFTTDLNTACPILNVELSTNNPVDGTVTAPTGLSYTFSSYDTIDEFISVVDSTKKGVHKFYLKVTAKGNSIWLFTNEFTLNVVCNDASTVVSHDSSMTLIQYVDTSNE